MSKNKSIWNNGDKILLLDNDYQNLRLFNFYKTVCLNRFKWVNLPEGLESRYIENALFNKGQAFFFNDSDNGFVCLPFSETGKQNIYGETESILVTGVNFSKTKLKIEGIEILDNETKTPPIIHVSYFVNLLTQVEKTINANLIQQKFPYVLTGTKKNILSLKNLLQEIGFEESNVSIVDELLSDSINANEGLKAINTNVPYILDKLQNFKSDVVNELYDYLGINNYNESKKERLLVDEVNANNDLIQMSLDTAFKMRKLACDKINKKYGLNIKIEKTINILSSEIENKDNERNDL